MSKPSGRKEDTRLPVLRVRVSPALIQALDSAADRTGQSRSATLRELLYLGLAERGVWPPQGRLEPAHVQ